MQANINVIRENVEQGKRRDPGHCVIARTFKPLGEQMRTLLRTLLICLLAPAAVVLAQDKPSEAVSSQISPLIAHNKLQYAGLKHILLESAQKMPEENYNFKPADVVRSYGQIVGHIADTQYSFCALALGEKNPALKIEQTKTSKADLIASLKNAFDYCDKAYDGMTGASGTQMVKFMGIDTPRFGVLMNNNIHTGLHYGNLVTYMRLKNIVPPSSEPGFIQQMQKLQQKK